MLSQHLCKHNFFQNKNKFIQGESKLKYMHHILIFCLLPYIVPFKSTLIIILFQWSIINFWRLKKWQKRIHKIQLIGYWTIIKANNLLWINRFIWLIDYIRLISSLFSIIRDIEYFTWIRKKIKCFRIIDYFD